MSGSATTPSIVSSSSSEVASEGVDLQFCRVLVNYDLPWNPMKVEQRIGRIDRLGQTAESISILNLGHVNTIDHRIFEKLLHRLGIFTRALGGLEGILGDVINELTTELLSRRLTPEQQEERIQRSALAVEQIRQRQEELEQQASHMIAHGGYILEQVEGQRTSSRSGSRPRTWKSMSGDYLNKYCPGFGFQQIGDEGLLFDIRLPASTVTALDDYMRKNRLHGRSRLATGDEAAMAVSRTRLRCHLVRRSPSASFIP